jgi:integrase
LEWYFPKWKRKELGEIRRPDVLARYSELWTEIGGSTANQAVAVLRALYKWAIDRELWTGTNPAKLLRDDKQYKEIERTRSLEPDELVRLCATCDKYETDTADHRDLAHFVLLTPTPHVALLLR